jgi:hypothetical protein
MSLGFAKLRTRLSTTILLFVLIFGFTILNLKSSHQISVFLFENVISQSEDAAPVQKSISNMTDDVNSSSTITTTFSLTEWRQQRRSNVSSFYENSHLGGKLRVNADEKGPILDFVIAGFAKCGTTTLEANLGYLAPMPDDLDICTPVHQTVYYSYINWPQQYASDSYPNGTEKILRGTKCPAYISGDWLKEWSTHLPRTKIIVGIRHPILWFQSFWNMQLRGGHLRFSQNPKTGQRDPYMITRPCYGRHCRNGCPNHQLFCTNRARFHLSLAALGKTSLSSDERQLLSPNDPDGGVNLKNNNITNSIFVYEQQELNEEYVWVNLAKYLDVEYIPHDKYRGSHDKKEPSVFTDFCEDQYDLFRAMMMPSAYELSVWLQEYFLPVAMDDNRPDVVVPNVTRMMEIVDTYKYDPCGKLIRLDNGTYIIMKEIRNATDLDS